MIFLDRQGSKMENHRHYYFEVFFLSIQDNEINLNLRVLKVVVKVEFLNGEFLSY